MIRITLAFIVAIFLAGCKVEISVPQGGTVVTQSGSFRCESGQTCSIDVYDIYFDEVFEAIPASGYTFDGWAKKDDALCGGEMKVCHLHTTSFEGNPNLMMVLESDEIFYLEPIFKPLPSVPAPTIYSLWGGSQQQFYLGCLNCSKFDPDSVCNPYGDYGSQFSPYSIWNKFEDFGSEFSNYSPWNDFAQQPPAVLGNDGIFYGYLTVNQFIPKRTNLAPLVNLVNHVNAGYDLQTARGAICQ